MKKAIKELNDDNRLVKALGGAYVEELITYDQLYNILNAGKITLTEFNKIVNYDKSRTKT